VDNFVNIVYKGRLLVCLLEGIFIKNSLKNKATLLKDTIKR